MEPFTRLQSVRSLMEIITVPVAESAVWAAFAVFVYFALGIFRVPGQSLLHMCVGYAVGVPLGFPVCLAAYTASCCSLFWLATEYAKGDSVEVYFEHAARLDVFALKISQQKYQIFVDKDGQKYDSVQLKKIADKKYQDKVERAKPEPENWDDWSGWDQNRFMYLLWARVFPFSPHWLLNLASGLLNNKGVIFSEFFVSTVLGSIPNLMFVVTVGALQNQHSMTEMIAWPWVKWPLMCCCMMVPGLISKSGFLEKYTKQKEIGWGPKDARILEESRNSR